MFQPVRYAIPTLAATALAACASSPVPSHPLAEARLPGATPVVVSERPAPAGSASAQDEEPTGTWGRMKDALASGRFWLQFRYRFEFVDQDGIPKDAFASTLRTVLGYETAAWHGISGLLEFTDVTAIGNDLYNSTTNGKTGRPVVADPDNTEVNQGYARYTGYKPVDARVGRQRIKLDNDRFIGNVGFRQNEQTFDGGSIQWKPVEEATLFYAYLSHVNRIFGKFSPIGRSGMQTHLIHGDYVFGPFAHLVGYWYWVDIDDNQAQSTQTVGVRATGQLGQGLVGRYALEYAHQNDIAQNPNNVDAGYRLIELGGSVHDDLVGLKGGWEVLEGSNGVGNKLTTPLATLHAHNGWADKFLNTPDAGLEDLYVGLDGKVQKLGWAALYHHFEAETGSTVYGDEVDLQATYKILDGVTIGAIYADYFARNFATDTRKIWFWLGFSV